MRAAQLGIDVKERGDATPARARHLARQAVEHAVHVGDCLGQVKVELRNAVQVLAELGEQGKVFHGSPSLVVAKTIRRRGTHAGADGVGRERRRHR